MCTVCYVYVLKDASWTDFCNVKRLLLFDELSVFWQFLMYQPVVTAARLKKQCKYVFKQRQRKRLCALITWLTNLCLSKVNLLQRHRKTKRKKEGDSREIRWRTGVPGALQDQSEDSCHTHIHTTHARTHILHIFSGYLSLQLIIRSQCMARLWWINLRCRIVPVVIFVNLSGKTCSVWMWLQRGITLARVKSDNLSNHRGLIPIVKALHKEPTSLGTIGGVWCPVGLMREFSLIFHKII